MGHFGLSSPKQLIYGFTTPALGKCFSNPEGPESPQTNTLVAPRGVDPKVHPLIHNFLAGSGVGAQRDSYRKIMYGNYAYYLGDDGAQWMIYAGSADERPRPFWNHEPGSDPNVYWGRPDPSVSVGTQGTLHIEFNKNSWESAALTNTSPFYEELLDQETPGTADEGKPYFAGYLSSSLNPDAGFSLYNNQRLRDAGQQQVYPGIFQHQLPGAGYGVKIFYDHNFYYRTARDVDLPGGSGPAVDVNVLDDRGYEIESIYNSYMDTDPDYERIIAPARIPECMLPNYYLLQKCFGQGQLSPLHLDYLYQVSLGTNHQAFSDLFSGDPSTIYSQHIDRGYWELYASVLGGQMEDPSTLSGYLSITDSMISDFRDQFKNIIVPLDDLPYVSVLNLEYTAATQFGGAAAGTIGTTDPALITPAIDTYPFYNKITIHDPVGYYQGVDTPAGQSHLDFFTKVANNALTGHPFTDNAAAIIAQKMWITSLQLMIAASFNPAVGAMDIASPIKGVVTQYPDPTLASGHDRTTGVTRPFLQMDFNSFDGFLSGPTSNTEAKVATAAKRKPIAVRAELDVQSRREGENLMAYEIMGQINSPWPARGPTVANITRDEENTTYGPANPGLTYYKTLDPGSIFSLAGGLWTQNANGTLQTLPGAAADDGGAGRYFNFSILRYGDRDASTGLFSFPGGDYTIDSSYIYDYIETELTRNLSSVFRGQFCAKSPLMYVIEKRIVNPGETKAPATRDPVQRIFLSRKFEEPTLAGPEFTDITYYDTQIKYGVRYQYDIKIVMAIFGTRYAYDADQSNWIDYPVTYDYIQLPLAASYAGRALGNALGFFGDHGAYRTMIDDCVGSAIDSVFYFTNGPVTPGGTMENANDIPGDECSPYFPHEFGGSLCRETDIGEDCGWETWKPELDTSVYNSHGISKYYGQTGYYVFALPASAWDPPSDAPPTTPAYSYGGGGDGGWAGALTVSYKMGAPGGDLPSFGGTTSPSHGTGPNGTGYWAGQRAQVNDPFGAGNFFGPNQALYKYDTAISICSHLYIEAVGGTGVGGNAEGGMIPTGVSIPGSTTSPLSLPCNDQEFIDWLEAYYAAGFATTPPGGWGAYSGAGPGFVGTIQTAYAGYSAEQFAFYLASRWDNPSHGAYPILQVFIEIYRDMFGCSSLIWNYAGGGITY